MFPINVCYGYFKYFHLTPPVALFLFPVNELLEFTKHIGATVTKDAVGVCLREMTCVSPSWLLLLTWMVA